MLLKRSVLPCLDRVPDLFHQVIVKIEVVQHQKTHPQHLLCLEQMVDVSARMPFARGAAAAFLQRTLVLFIALVEQVHPAVRSVGVPVPPVAARVDAVEKVHATVNRLQN